jgi:SAM-dependent methyltransferase
LIYSEDYFSGGEYPDYLGEQKALIRNFRRRILVLKKLSPNSERLVEIGSGYGYFHDLASRHWKVKGVEISEFAAQQAQDRGLDVLCVDYLSVNMQDFKPQIICLWDTIEHIKNPRKVLEKIVYDLQPGGLITISTGDIGAWLPRIQKSNWRLIHPPSHLWYFSSKTLTQLLLDVGVKPIQVIRPIFYRSLRAFLGPISKYLPRSIGDLPIPLQTGDIIEVYAYKCSPYQ